MPGRLFSITYNIIFCTTAANQGNLIFKSTLAEITASNLDKKLISNIITVAS